MNRLTLAELIDQAIVWEADLRDLYAGLSEAFPAYPSINEFWKHMAIEESSHGTLLRHARASIPDAQLSHRLGDNENQLVAAAREALAEASEIPLRTLDDAYEIAHTLESSEINIIFRLLLMAPISGEDMGTLLAAQFEEHIEKLNSFGLRYDPLFRKSVLVMR